MIPFTAIRLHILSTFGLFGIGIIHIPDFVSLFPDNIGMFSLFKIRSVPFFNIAVHPSSHNCPIDSRGFLNVLNLYAFFARSKTPVIFRFPLVIDLREDPFGKVTYMFLVCVSFVIPTVSGT